MYKSLLHGLEIYQKRQRDVARTKSYTGKASKVSTMVNSLASLSLSGALPGRLATATVNPASRAARVSEGWRTSTHATRVEHT